VFRKGSAVSQRSRSARAGWDPSVPTSLDLARPAPRAHRGRTGQCGHLTTAGFSATEQDRHKTPPAGPVATAHLILPVTIFMASAADGALIDCARVALSVGAPMRCGSMPHRRPTAVTSPNARPSASTEHTHLPMSAHVILRTIVHPAVSVSQPLSTLSDVLSAVRTRPP
jgi:hypothetical protein